MLPTSSSSESSSSSSHVIVSPLNDTQLLQQFSLRFGSSLSVDDVFEAYSQSPRWRASVVRRILKEEKYQTDLFPVVLDAIKTGIRRNLGKNYKNLPLTDEEARKKAWLHMDKAIAAIGPEVWCNIMKEEYPTFPETQKVRFSTEYPKLALEERKREREQKDSDRAFEWGKMNGRDARS